MVTTCARAYLHDNLNEDAHLHARDGSETVHDLKVGEVLEVEEGKPHVLLPETDCLTFEWWEGPFVPQSYGFTNYMVKVMKNIDAWNKAAENAIKKD